MPLPKLIVIVGPTASGKSALAIRLAKKFGGEIISADSRQFYRGTEIGSGAVRGERRKLGGRSVLFSEGVPHHLIGFLSPTLTFSAAQFKDHAVRIARDVAKRGKVPIMVGGTGLFVQTVVDNYQVPEVPPNEAFRARMEKRSVEALYAELKKMDPAYFARIPAGNRRYATRALEVMRATGKRFSELQTKGEPLFDVLMIGVAREREELDRKIGARVDAMMQDGLLEETRRLGKRHGWDAPAATGLGHRQLGMHLRGEMPLKEAVTLIKQETRRYARRQMTWFRRDARLPGGQGRIRWVKGVREATPLVRLHLRSKNGILPA